MEYESFLHFDCSLCYKSFVRIVFLEFGKFFGLYRGKISRFSLEVGDFLCFGRGLGVVWSGDRDFFLFIGWMRVKIGSWL